MIWGGHELGRWRFVLFRGWWGPTNHELGQSHLDSWGSESSPFLSAGGGGAPKGQQNGMEEDPSNLRGTINLDGFYKWVPGGSESKWWLQSHLAPACKSWVLGKNAFLLSPGTWLFQAANSFQPSTHVQKPGAGQVSAQAFSLNVFCGGGEQEGLLWWLPSDASHFNDPPPFPITNVQQFCGVSWDRDGHKPPVCKPQTGLVCKKKKWLCVLVHAHP